MAAGDEENAPQETESALGCVVSGSERVLTSTEFEDEVIHIKSEPEDIFIPDSPTSQQDAAKPQPLAVIVESTEGKKYVMYTSNDKKGTGKELPKMTTETVMFLRQAEEEGRQCGCVIEQLTQKGYDKRSRDLAETMSLIEKGPPKLDSINWPCMQNIPTRYLEMHWITGCKKTFRFYCWPCILFANVATLWASGGVAKKNDFNKLYGNHENTPDHLHAAIKLEILKDKLENSRNSMQKQLIQKSEANKQSVREVFKLAAILLQEKQEGLLDTGCLLTLSGHRDNQTLMNIRNLHRDIITCLNRALTEHIEQEIRQALYYSCTIDSIGQKRVVAIARFVSKTGELTDRFIKVFHLDSGLPNIVNELEHIGEPNGSFIALSVGNIPDLETLVSKEPNYGIFHSPIHRIANVLPTTFKSIKECVVFFLTMKGLGTLISLCPDWIASEFPDVEPKQWEDNLIVTAYKNKSRLMSLFESNNLKIGPKLGEAYTISLGLYKAFEDLEFSFLLRVFAEIIPQVERCLDCLNQTKAEASHTLIEHVNETYERLRVMRGLFDSIWVSVDQTSRNGVNGLPAKRARHVRSSKLTNYYKTLYENIVDTFIDMVRIRFSDVEITVLATLLSGSSQYKITSVKKNRRGNFDTLRHKIDKGRLKYELKALEDYKDLSSLPIEQMMVTMEKSNMTPIVPQLMKLARLSLALPYVSNSNQASQISFLEEVKKATLQKRAIPYTLQLHANKLTDLMENRDFVNRLLRLFSVTHTVELSDT